MIVRFFFTDNLKNDILLVTEQMNKIRFKFIKKKNKKIWYNIY